MNSGASMVRIHMWLCYMRCATHLSAKTNSYMRIEPHIEPRNTPPFDHVAGTPSHDSNITKSRLMASHTCTAFVVAHQVVVLVGKSPCSITRESNDRSRFRMGTRGDNPRIGLHESRRFDIQLPWARAAHENTVHSALCATSNVVNRWSRT